MENIDKKEVTIDPNEPKSEITEQHIESFEDFDDKKMVKTLNTKGNVAYKYKKHVDMTGKIVVDNEQLKNLQPQEAPKKQKSHKGAIAALSCLAILGIASGVAAPLIIWNKTKIDPRLVEHKINFKNAENWIIKGPTSAKKGDTVKFDVTKNATNEVNKVPDYLSVGSSRLTLTKDENETNTWTTGDIVWEFVEDKTITLTLKNEVVSDVTWDVGFDLNGGTTSEQSKLYQKVQDKAKVTNIPNIAAPTTPANYVFDKWQISTDLGTTWNDFDIANDVITSSAIIKPIWKYSEDIKHTVNFVIRDGETSSGTTSVEIENNTLWKDVTKPTIEKTSYELDGWYYIDETGTVQSLADDTKFTFEHTVVFNVYANWKEAKGTISFGLKDDKLSYVTTPEASYKVESGTKLSEIARPTIKGSKDSQKVYYPNGTWLIKDSDGNWTDVDEETVFNSSTHITIAPDYSEVELGSDVTTSITFDAGEGDFGSGEKTKTFTQTQTITAETAEMGCKWSDIKSSEPTTINAPTGWQLVEDNKWGVTLTDDTLMFGNVTLKANYTPTEKHEYTIQLISDDDNDIAWSGMQYYTKEYAGKPEDETSLKLGDLGFIKIETSGTNDIYSLDESIVKPAKTGFNLIGWKYFDPNDNTWKKCSEASYASSIYKTIYNMKLSSLADTDGNIKIKPMFEAQAEKRTIVLVSSTPEVYIDGGINVFKVEKSINKLSDIMDAFDRTWKSNNGPYVPIYYTNMLANDEKLDINSVITASNIVLQVHWGKDAFSATTSLVKNLAWEHEKPDDEKTKVGTVIPQCLWYDDKLLNTLDTYCQDVYDWNWTVDEMAEFFGYDKAEDLIGLERTAVINGLAHKYRVVGIQHDTIADGTYAGQKAVLTFDSVNVLSNENGYTLRSKWNSTEDNVNYNYTTSQIRKNLTGEGDASKTVKWYQDSTTTYSENRPAWEMLPSELQSAIKKVTKQVSTSDGTGTTPTYSVTSYSDTLFPLTMTEMGQVVEESSGFLKEGEPYKYWSNNEQKSDDDKKTGRIKKNLYSENNNPTVYWLASPIINNKTKSFSVWSNGGIKDVSSNYTLLKQVWGVGFAFCI